MHFKVPLWGHQLEALHRTKDRDSYALFFEQGTGKTATLINIYRDKCRQQQFNLSALILCPQIVVDNWRREFLAHSEVAEDKILCLRGSGEKRLKDLKASLGEDGLIVVTNYETLNMPKVFDQLLRLKPDMLVLDESHKCKDVTSKRTKRAIELSKNSRFRFILSGTPVVNKTFDIFSQFLIMDGGKTFGSKIRDFKEEYFIDENAYMPRNCYFPNWQPKIGALARINAKINENSMRVKKEECLDLPPLVRQRVDVELTGTQARVYRDIEKDMVSIIGNQEVTADMAIKQALRLQQVTSGYTMSDDDTVVELENPKLKALEELLDQIEPHHKIIVWAVFRRDYQQIRGLLKEKGIQYVEATGDISADGKREAIEAFEATLVSKQNRSSDPRQWTSGPRVFLGHPAAAGIGANLTAAAYAIFYSRGFSLENDLQAEARNFRGGSDIHESITRIDIVARGTIDETVMEALAAKQNISECLLQTIRRK